MKSLLEIYNKHKVGDWPDKNSTHSYLPVYEKLLAPYRDSPDNNILEIGLMSGESLRMWSEYFAGSVFGIDCDIKPLGGVADLTGAIAEGFKIAIGDAANPADIEKHFKGIKFDVVIEDANHDIMQQVEIHKALTSYMNEGSIYIIEDIQDIDFYEDVFKIMGAQIIDRRHIKGRYDDVMVVLKRNRESKK